jgi:group II intron reverse transcriptase/maturase
VTKRANKGGQKAPAEPVERRVPAEGNLDPQAVTGAPYPEAAWSWRERIRLAAQRDAGVRFTSLLHHITPGLLCEAFFALRRQASPGIDGVTWDAYADDLHRRLADLHKRVQDGRYRALPAKRVWIPKPDGRQRPLGVPALEDKIVQQALVWVLECIYEVDFRGFSYGFRPGRSCHDALDALSVALTQRKVSWVLDADIQGFFDTVDHRLLLGFLERRIADPRVLRLVGKFLRAGVSEDGEWSKTEVGTPQGAVISPLLANIYLHYVLDQWVDWWRAHQARGEVYIVRYADDFVIGFQYRSDATALRCALAGRFREHGLKLHPEKTRLLEFGRFAIANRRERGQGKPESFDFLGFTHRCAHRRDGAVTVRRTTMATRLRATLARLREQIWRRMHRPVAETGRWLRAVVQGYLNYFAVPGNQRACEIVRTEVNRAWFTALRRRSQRARSCMNWKRFNSLVRRWIPRVRVLHPYPNERLVV